MSKGEGVKNTPEKNWKRFVELTENPDFQSRFAELQKEFTLPVPSEFPFSIGNTDDIERAFRKAYYECFPLYLLACVGLRLARLNSEEKYFPENFLDRMFQTYYEIGKSPIFHRESSRPELDPFRRRLIEAVDLSNPYSAIILVLIAKYVIMPKGQDRHGSSLLLATKKLGDKGITQSDVELVFILDILWWFFYTAFWKDLRTILNDFSLGSEWLGPMFMYAITGKMLYVPRVNTEPETSLVIPLKYHELVKSYVNFWGTNQKKGIDVTARLIPLPGRKQIVPLELPPGTKYEQITIEFLNEQDVKITAPGFSINTDYKEMGFQDNRTQIRLPNKQWNLLIYLAKNHGELSWSDPKANSLIKQRKKLLSDSLKACFQIDEDPFYPYEQIGAYKIKINLIPD